LVQTEIDLLRRMEENAIAVAAQRRDVLTVGPFQALLDPHTPMTWVNYAVPIAPLGNAADVDEALAALRRAFDERWRTIRFEFTEELWPDLPAVLERAGLELEARHPVMVVTPAAFQPFCAPAVRVRLLTGTEGSEDLAAYLGAGPQCFGGEPQTATGEEIARFHEELDSGRLRYGRADLDGKLAGIACTTPLEEVAELAGVGTLPAVRRRGVAATLCSFLVQDHFDAGGELVWLSAGDAVAQALYERIGFRVTATRLNYIDSTATG
jgi:ribosomal protein S18 acetylase RimI-like enzyme